ncbi:histidine kinase [Hymenobacter sp. M29]|uniref:histidine kinase n=1 Tax=Hymenobacter mellowenesis TaxID=3063995 RepID=A0ABT9AEC2_9BACT|nr:histidine kinase [Hymenobacter sp. M29]MDO7848185.1 histidine kinase [Hymenobacter sp. M29]
MLTDTPVTFFLPAALRADKTHPRYTEFYVVATTCVFGIALLFVGAAVMRYVGLPPLGLYINAALAGGILLSMRWFGHYRIPMSLTAIGSVFIIYGFIRNTGMIFSINVNLLHMYLVVALLADKKWGWTGVLVCLGALVYVYFQTPAVPSGMHPASLTSNPLYALSLHVFIAVFIGGALAYGHYTGEQSRLTIHALQNQKISLLDEAVRQRTEQLNTMRQAVAADFHDETGNVLAAITRQAALLEMQLCDQPEVLPILKAISDNSNRLYASSKDFLWDLHHESDQPEVLFQYLTAYGQQYYNQFDIAFSAELIGEDGGGQLPPFASLNLIYIFKEAMGNVVKHAGATEVTLALRPAAHEVTYILQDNGRWAEPEGSTGHYGLQNMRHRCQKHHLGFGLHTDANGTRIEITAPVHTTFIS